MKDGKLLKRIGQTSVIVILLLALQLGAPATIDADDGCSGLYDECCETKIGVLTVPKITCGMIFYPEYCAIPGYTDCAYAAFEQYVTCTKTTSESTCYSELRTKIEACKQRANASAVECADFCSRVGIEHLVWDKKSAPPECACRCEDGYGKEGNGCVLCETMCQKMDTRAHYDSAKSQPDQCECKCTAPLMRFEWGAEQGKCACVPGAVPAGNGCECPEGWEPSAFGDKCIPVEETKEKTPLDEERERITKQYPGLKKGYLLFSEGVVSKATGVIPFKSYDKYGHVGVYIGDYEVPPGKTYQVRDPAAAPLKVYRKDDTGAYQVVSLPLAQTIKPGDWIIGAVVEMRWNGAVFTTVDGMKRQAYDTMGRAPNFDWKTTDPPPTASQVEDIVEFVLSKVDLTERGKLGYWFGCKGTPARGYEECWDCGNLGEGAYEYASHPGNPLDPTPKEYETQNDWYLRPQEVYDYIDAPSLTGPSQEILINVRSPVYLQIRDGQGRTFGLDDQGLFHNETPFVYYQPEIEEYPQAILVTNVRGELRLILSAFDEGQFTLEILDQNASTPGSLVTVGFQDISIKEGTKAWLVLGIAGNDYSMGIDDDGDGNTERTLSPTSIKSTPISSETTAPSGLTFESRSKPKGSDVQIPLTLKGISGSTGNMDLTLTYDPNVLTATEVLKGSLTATAIFDYAISSGTIRLSLADSRGFSGDGSVAYIRFSVTGAEGSSSELRIDKAEANQSNYSPITPATHNGLFRVSDIDELRGDCDGDGKLSAVDALCALQMAVGKRSVDLAMDVSDDGKVTSLDARQILKTAVAQTEPANSAPITTTDADQFKTLARECQPAQMVMKVGENGEMEILYRIEGQADGDCVLYEKVLKDSSLSGLEGKDMTCKVPMESLIGGISPEGDFSIKECCTGSLAEAIDEIGKRALGEE